MFRARVLLAVLVLGTLLMSVTPALAAPPPPVGFAACSQWYVVQPGDNLYRIALRYNTSVYTLMQLNGMSNPNVVYVGQRLCVRGGAPVPFGFFYVVQRGDTLFSIAQRNGLSVWLLATVNHIYNPNQIYVGQVLFIPSRAALEMLDNVH